MNLCKKNLSGFSLVEVLIVVAVMGLVFTGLFASFEYTLKLTSESRAKMTALSLLNDRIEYLRSLTYDSVGTVSGIPLGLVPQNRSVSLNGINFHERVLVEYVDDASDGSGVLDTNGILSDYKRVKVEFSWKTGDSATSSVYLVSSIVPRSIETTAGGGTLRVNVFDSSVTPLPGIDVRLLNTTTTSTIDITRTTDASGTALFTGAPAASNYEIFVSSPGYSSDQTRQATTSLPNPNTLPVTVLEADVSTMYFAVDKTSDLNIKIINSQTKVSVADSFADMLGVDTVNNATTSSGSLILTDVGGVYDSSGLAILDPVTPSPLLQWGIVKLQTSLPSLTSAKVSFYTSTNTVDIISDTDLPGNASGFSDTYIDLRSLDVGTYPTLVAGISLLTTDTSVTPEVEEFTINYIESEIVSSAYPIDVRGGKTIGTFADLTPVYKYDISTTTDINGKVVLENVEWDQYEVSVPFGDVIAESCPHNPFLVDADTNTDVELLVNPVSSDNLRVVVQTSAGDPVIEADVDLSRPGYSDSIKTGWCGQSFFNGITGDSDYTLQVSASGYSSQTLTPLIIVVGSSAVQVITLVP